MENMHKEEESQENLDFESALNEKQKLAESENNLVKILKVCL